MNNLFSRLADDVFAQYPKNRLLTIDVFRGISIGAMILVNNPGSWSYVYSPLRHAEWHGWHLADIIFPFFIFIMGLSVSIKVQTLKKQNITYKESIYLAFYRSAKLFGLGVLLALFYFDFQTNSFSWWQHQLASFRLFGVLQRLALVYFALFVLNWFLSVRSINAFISITLLIYWYLLTSVAYADEIGRVYVGELIINNNIVGWFDNQLLAANHLHFSELKPFAFDPEGTMSSIGALSTGLLGVLTGRLLIRTSLSSHYVIQKLLVWGVIFTLIGSLWHDFLPINKSLWTPSFVILTAGLAWLMLALLMFVIELKNYKSWSAPFVVMGVNAILMYMVSAILARLLIILPINETSWHGYIYTQFYQTLFGSYLGSFLFSISLLLFVYVFMHVLYKRQIFYRV